MYVDSAKIKRGDKVYTRNLLRTSYRENGKVKHKTILNLSICSDEEIAALKLALKHKGNLAAVTSVNDIETQLGKSIGAVWAMNSIAQKIGLAKALGKTPEAQTALMQVIARVIDQGSRLSAVRFAERQGICEILNIKKLDEDDLYENLTWLADHQEEIEKKIFDFRFPGKTPSFFLYDVTSSYLEGDENALSNWGYNRDKKGGKKQIVIGLLTGPDGLPVAVRVFKGNTVDTQTVAEQVRILAKSFGVKNVTLVGDRGMLKGPQIAALPDDFRYVTAISKPQIQKMLGNGTLQMELFNDKICEVESDNIRYVLRRNPIRKQQIGDSRKSKLASIAKTAEERTTYLAEHPRADASKARDKVTAKIKKLKAVKWLTATVKSRIISVEIDKEALSQIELLDGCYVIKSDLSKEDADTQSLHDRYCDLEMVERSFRTMKTTHLELRPIFVQKSSSTKGHVFVVMLALLLQRELERAISDINITAEEAIDTLASIHTQEIKLGASTIQNIPKPAKLAEQILKKLSVKLPTTLPNRKSNVHTKKKLQSQRKPK